MQAAGSRTCSAIASVGSSAASHVTTLWYGPASAPRWHQCQAHFWSSTRRSHADSRSCTVIIRSNTAGAAFNHLSLSPRRGLVQQGLSAARDALGFYWLGLAADKRYSSGVAACRPLIPTIAIRPALSSPKSSGTKASGLATDTISRFSGRSSRSATPPLGDRSLTASSSCFQPLCVDYCARSHTWPRI